MHTKNEASQTTCSRIATNKNSKSRHELPLKGSQYNHNVIQKE